MNKYSIASLTVIPALLMGGIANPTQAHPVQRRETLQIAQVLDSNSPQARNAEVIVQNFLTLLSQQKFEQAKQYLSPAIAGYSSTAQLQQLWQKLQKDTGPLVKVDEINATELLGVYTVIATVRFQNSTEDLTFKLDQNERITEADFLWLGNMKTDAEQFVAALAKGDYGVARTYLAPELKAKYLPDTIKQRWETVIAKTGPFKQIKSTSVIRGGSYDAVQLDLDFQNYSGKVYVYFNPLSQIIAIDSPLNKR
jgi:hypothetical protein